MAINQVFFGTEAATIVSYTSTTIVVLSPANKPGLYNLIIPSGSNGNALYTYISKFIFYYELLIKYVYLKVQIP